MQKAYLDHAAATPMRPAVREEMAALSADTFGNPSSAHATGRRARALLDEARERVAAALGAAPSSVYFVRGGTESDNLAILGRARRVVEEGHRPLVVRSAVEHSAVREAVDAVAREGGEAAILQVSPGGEVDEDALRELVARRPALVSVMAVNHETGSVLPLEKVGRACRDGGVPLHVDAVQGVGRVSLDPDRIDLLSISGHKFGGPRGTGLLVVRDASGLSPRLFGGGQEGALRPGTEDVVAARGLALALEITLASSDMEARRLGELRGQLQEGLRARIPGLRVHGEEGPRAPHLLNVGLEGVPTDLLPRALDMEGVEVSAGSACASGAGRPSPVLAACYGEAYARDVAPLRLSLGWTTHEEEIELALERIPMVVERVFGAGVATGGAPGSASGVSNGNRIGNRSAGGET